MTLMPELETPRLLLRNFRLTDFEDVYPYHADPDVVRYLYWEVRTPAEVQEVLQKRLEQNRYQEGQPAVWAVERRSDHRVIGEVVLMCRSLEHQQAEVGYVFHPQAAGQGYATEAVRAVIDFAFRQLPIHRICGRTDARNPASQKLLRRLGMRLEAHLIQNEIFKGEWSDEMVFAVLKPEWLQKQNPPVRLD